MNETKLKSLDDILTEIEKLAAAATKGPWRDRNPMIYGAKIKSSGHTDVCKTSEVFMDKTQRERNSAFIAKSRDLVPRLLAVVREAVGSVHGLTRANFEERHQYVADRLIKDFDTKLAAILLEGRADEAKR